MCLLILGIGILYTLVSDSRSTVLKGVSVQFNTSDDALVAFSAVPQKNETDRTANIARLRDLLKETELVIVPTPSTESTNEASSTAPVVDEVKSITLQKCMVFEDSLSLIQSLPSSGISVREQNGKREVIFVPQVATSTPSVPQTEKVLLALPLSPSVNSAPSCVSSDVIGITPFGVLILNSDVSLYRGYGPEYLVGYARDGFPIYGYYEGDVDSCGGYQAASGYRYAISSDRDFILGCFVGSVSPFTQ